jgi:hypothetical protein
MEKFRSEVGRIGKEDFGEESMATGVAVQGC